MKTSPGCTRRESYATPLEPQYPGTRGKLHGSAASDATAMATVMRSSLSTQAIPGSNRRSGARRLARDHDAVAVQPRGQPDRRQHAQRFARAQSAKIRKIARVAGGADRNDRGVPLAAQPAESPAGSSRRATSTGGGALSVGERRRCRSVACGDPLEHGPGDWARRSSRARAANRCTTMMVATGIARREEPDERRVVVDCSNTVPLTSFAAVPVLPAIV